MKSAQEKLNGLPAWQFGYTLKLIEGQLGDLFVDVAIERAAQDHQWGGPEHDDNHDEAEWVQYIGRQCSLLDPASPEYKPGTFRERMVKVAALALAAAAADDRKNVRVCGCPVCDMERDLQAAGISTTRVRTLAEMVELLSGLGARKPGSTG